MVPWLTLYMDTCGNVGTVGQCRSCCMHTQCYIYSTHTGGQDKSRVHVHAPHTPTQTIERRANTPSTSAVHGCCYPGAQASKTRRIDHPHEPPSNTQLFDLRWLRRRTVSGVPAWPLSSSSVSLLLIITSWGAGKRAISKLWAPDYRPGGRKPCFDLCLKEENLPGIMGGRQIT